MSTTAAAAESGHDEASEGPARVNDFLDPDGAPQADAVGRTKEASLPEVNVAVPEAKSSRVIKWPTMFAWIPKNLSWPHAKDIFRCTLTAWVSLILILIKPVIVELGIASFLILIAALLSPPAEPFAAVFEREIIILICATMAWAWSCLGIKLASLARSSIIYPPNPALIFTGYYIEAAPTVIFAVFLFIGTAFFLWLKAAKGPGPYIFGSVFGCICLVINLTTAHFFPYPYYVIGQAVLVPLAIHSGLAFIGSLFIFPVTLSGQFAQRLSGVLTPLHGSLVAHKAALDVPNSVSVQSSQEPEPFQARFARAAAPALASAAAAEAALVPLRLTSRLLPLDTVFSRNPPDALEALHDPARRLAVRAHGLGLFFRLIDFSTAFPLARTTADRKKTGGAVPATTTTTSENRTLSQTSTISSEEHHHSTLYETLLHHARHAHFSSRPTSRPTSPRQSHIQLGSRPLSRPLSRAPSPVRVGAFEEAAYSVLAKHQRPGEKHDQYAENTTRLLRESTAPLLDACIAGLDEARAWLGRANTGLFGALFRKRPEECKEKGRIQAARVALGDALKEFRTEKRFTVLDQYRIALDPNLAQQNPEAVANTPPYRYLFHCYYYQHQLGRFGENLHALLLTMENLDKGCGPLKLYLPAFTLLRRLFHNFGFRQSDHLTDHLDDENPDEVQGVTREMERDLGYPAARNPDMLPPRNMFEHVTTWLYEVITALFRGNCLFALKGAVLTVLLALTFYMKSSAEFAYKNRFLWGVIMGQLTIARFRGDTIFGFTARIIATFLGAVLGCVIWYISTGLGDGNPYGLAATCAVAFPLMFFGRLYWPGPPMTNLVFFVTSVLVFGYSWQDTHNPSSVNPGKGIEVAWRRFVLVVVGVTAAFLFSFLPPSTTLRAYQRNTLATTGQELGTVYTAVVSFASRTAHHHEHSPQIRARETAEMIKILIAIRAKLKRAIFLKTNISYEFSFRGRWPAERYQTILELQLQAAYLLSHLMSAVEQLEPAWADAFLKRSRFLDADFQGDVLGVISLISTSLRTGHPLPQVTPCPLLDRFMRHSQPVSIPQPDHSTITLPRDIGLNVLMNEQYLIFTVAVTIAFHCVAAIDRLMLAVKELVGETYHISGLGRAKSHEGSAPWPGYFNLRPGQEV